MGKVSINDLQPGMVLEKSALSSDNRVLLNAGTELNRKHIRVFKTWGLVEVDVEGVTREELEAQSIARMDKAKLERAQQCMKELFRHTDTAYPPVAELLYLCTLRRLDRMLQGKS